MKVSELIDELSRMPMDAEVRHLWDGGLRSGIELVWLTRNGVVATSDFDEPCYDVEDRPSNAPGMEKPYWHTPSRPRTW